MSDESVTDVEQARKVKQFIATIGLPDAYFRVQYEDGIWETVTEAEFWKGYKSCLGSQDPK